MPPPSANISQVVSAANLLDNALKFSPENSTITVGLNSADQNTVDIWISDEGPGVQEDELDLLTKRFYRHNNVSNIPGSGLGLSIVEWIVKEHNGGLAITNNPGDGLKVTVTLPVN